MSPVVKFTLARVGLFLAVLAALLPVPLNFLIKLLLALVASAAFSFLLLGHWRREVAEQLASAVDRRRSERSRLRAALAGDEAPAGDGEGAAAGTADSGTAGGATAEGTLADPETDRKDGPTG
jgi:membrane protein implicated in regulation of membrane protease activity